MLYVILLFLGYLLFIIVGMLDMTKEKPFKLFLDDFRDPPDDTWVVARNADEAIIVLKTQDVEYASLDHDLGHCNICTECTGYTGPCGCRCHLTGYFVVCWMETENIWPRQKPVVHSRNPSGAAKMRAVIDKHYD